MKMLVFPHTWISLCLGDPKALSLTFLSLSLTWVSHLMKQLRQMFAILNPTQSTFWVETVILKHWWFKGLGGHPDDPRLLWCFQTWLPSLVGSSLKRQANLWAENCLGCACCYPSTHTNGSPGGWSGSSILIIPRLTLLLMLFKKRERPVRALKLGALVWACHSGGMRGNTAILRGKLIDIIGFV